jgi:hypothetical protein
LSGSACNEGALQLAVLTWENHLAYRVSIAKQTSLQPLVVPEMVRLGDKEIGYE